MERLNIRELLQSVTGEEINISYYVINSIKDCPYEEQVQDIRSFCQLHGNVKSDKSFRVEQVISETRYEELKAQYGHYVDNLLRTVLSKAYVNEWEEDRFYSSLWKSLTNGGVLETIEEWAFGLYFIVIDRRIPYFRLSLGQKMSQDRFEDILESNRNTINKLKYVLAFPFDEKTEEASIILEELEKVSDKDVRIVLLSVVINHLRKEREHAFSLLKDLLNID